MTNKNPFGNISNQGLEDTGDRLAGGGGVFDSGIYEGTIALAYAGESSGGAKSLTVHIQIGDRQYRETMYITSGKEKGQLNYYTKDDKKIPLPGFTIANDLSLMSTGIELGQQDFEEKVAKLYDFESRQEVDKKVMVPVEMLGKPITVAIMKTLENKRKKNESSGAYEPVAETREINNIDKVFHSETGKTVSEYVGKKPAEFLDKWKERNEGRVIDKVQDVGGRSGAPGQAGRPSSGNTGGGSKPKSLFGEKG